MKWGILFGLFAAGASASAGAWAYDGNPLLLSASVFLSFAALAFLVERYSVVAGDRLAEVAAALLRSEGRTSAKVMKAADTLAETLVAQDAITADTLEKADLEVTRNVRSEDS